MTSSVRNKKHNEKQIAHLEESAKGKLAQNSDRK